MIKFLLALLLLPVLSHAVEFKDGDLIFHKSSSEQGPVLQFLTGSPWTHVGIILKHGEGRYWVAEATGSRVRFSRLEQFIERGREGHYVVKRLIDGLGNFEGTEERTRLRTALDYYVGREYDIWFQWSDDTIYCSELGWKIYKDVLGVELVAPQRFRDFPLETPQARELIRVRYTQQGRPFNPEELVVSPIHLMNSELLIEVDRNSP